MGAGVISIDMNLVSSSEAHGKAKSICCALLMLWLAVLPTNLYAKKLFLQKAGAKQIQLKPEIRLPVAALGYLPPGALPSFEYHALVGLYFVDANHLLFTFNVKRLLQRDDICSTSDSRRTVRAVVLDIPSGKVETQAEWELADYSDYLWSLGNARFLLRRCSKFDLVNSSLHAQLLIDTHAVIDGLELSPDRSIVAIEQTAPRPSARRTSAFLLDYPVARKADVEFVRLSPLAVIARSQIPLQAAVPIVEQGNLEALTATRNRWTIDIRSFKGVDRKIATVHSDCMPGLTALSDTLIVAGTCSGDSRRFQAFDMKGLLLWQIPLGPNRHDPQFLLTRNGAHFAIESVHATRMVAPFDSSSDEVIDIYQTLTGVRIGGLHITPIYTAGKNADFSPDDTRLAVLHNGAIEIYSLQELAKNRH